MGRGVGGVIIWSVVIRAGPSERREWALRALRVGAGRQRSKCKGPGASRSVVLRTQRGSMESS